MMEGNAMRYRRDRSGFWIYINVNDEAYNISTNSKYVNIINAFSQCWKKKVQLNGKKVKIMII